MPNNNIFKQTSLLDDDNELILILNHMIHNSESSSMKMFIFIYKYNKQEYGKHTRNDFQCILHRHISRATCMDVTYSIYQNYIQNI